VLAPRLGLVVLGDNILQAWVRQDSSPLDKTRIIESAENERKLSSFLGSGVIVRLPQVRRAGH
jgi:hypothetical protein